MIFILSRDFFKTIAPTVFLAITVLLLSTAVSAQESQPIIHRTIEVDQIKIFYREAGQRNKPTVLLLHGFPSSSRMYVGLIPLLAKNFHVVAPDYPGFGYSQAPDPKDFAYTFENLTKIIDQFTRQLKLDRYALYLSDYGGPVGFRLAAANPESITALIIQNAVIHEEGLAPVWESRRAFWRDRKAHEEDIRRNFSSLEAARLRHLGRSPRPERINPDTWTDEYAFLTRPGIEAIQLDLLYDYQTNVKAYPKWQAYLREKKPRTLIVWGKYDPAFTINGALAYLKEVPEAEIHLLNAGHFALDEECEQIAEHIIRFLN